MILSSKISLTIHHSHTGVPSMIRQIFALTLALMTSACSVYEPGTIVQNNSTFTSSTNVTINYGTNDRNRPPRHTSVFSCSSINGLHDYLDYGETDRSCRIRTVTAARKIERYNSIKSGRVDIYEFMVNGWYFYSHEPSLRGYPWQY